MKAFMNTFLALCFSYLSFGQCYESTFFGYSESLKEVYERRVDSLPYEYALIHYFNEKPIQCTDEACTSIPGYYFILAKSEFLFMQGKYPAALCLLDSILQDKIRFNLESYLHALMLRVKIQLKLGNSTEAGKIISELDAAHRKNSITLSNKIDFRIRNAKAEFLIRSNNYNNVAKLLLPVLNHDNLQTKEDSLIHLQALILTGEFYMDQSKFDSAHYFFNESYTILKQLYHENHAAFIPLQLQLGDLYKNTGKHNEAEQYYKKAEKIFINKIGRQHRDYANIQRLLANLYRKMGRFDLADEKFADALRILKNAGFENTRSHAITLSNQAAMFTAISKRKEAEINLLIAKKIMQNNGDTLGLEYAMVLQTLANLYHNQLKLTEAETLLLKTSELRKAIQGEMHPDYADCLNNLGNIYQKRGDYTSAELFYEKAIRIAADPQSRNTAVCPHFYNNLALLYSKTNQFPKAESLFFETKKLLDVHPGKINRTYLTLLDNIAELYIKMNNQNLASFYLIEASKLRKRLIYDSFRYLSSNEIDGFMQRFRRGITNFNNYLLEVKIPSDSLLIEAFENELFYKGFLLNYHLELNNLIQIKPELAKLNDSIKIIYKSIAQEQSKLIPDVSVIDSLERMAIKLEKEIGRKSEGYESITKRIGFDDLLKRLKPKQAIVEIMYLNQKSDPGMDSVYYSAMIVSKESKVPVFQKLCSEEQLLSIFPRSNKLNADYVTSIYNLNSRGLIPVEKNKSSLYELIWKKLEPHIKNAQTVFYTPVGLLHNINIQAIQVNKNQIAGMGRDIIQLTSSRQLLSNTKKERPIRSALLMGGIQYDKIDKNVDVDLKLEAKSRGLMPSNETDPDKNYWPELNHSFREVYHLADLLQHRNIKVKKYSGADASEEIFKSNVGRMNPGIIHVATHGYFFPESKQMQTNDGKSKNCPFMYSSNPMMRSGLVLAYGNHGWTYCEPLPGRSEDGILTAFEISQMNLHNTKLAVLSACETGLGDIKGPEGVFGLQRAFKIAGVKYIVMSLWQIPDSQTEELMIQFYANMLQHKMEIPKAFKQAQMQMRMKYNDPYFWAGFVLVQ